MKKNLFAMAVLSLALIPSGLFADGMGVGMGKDVNGLKVELTVGTTKAKVGTNQVAISIHDAQGKEWPMRPSRSKSPWTRAPR